MAPPDASHAHRNPRALISRYPANLTLGGVLFEEREQQLGFLLECDPNAFGNRPERLDQQYRGLPLSFRLPRARNDAVDEERRTHLQILERHARAVLIRDDPRPVVV